MQKVSESPCALFTGFIYADGVAQIPALIACRLFRVGFSILHTIGVGLLAVVFAGFQALCFVGILVAAG